MQLILLIRDDIVVLEARQDRLHFRPSARLKYALLLHYFHKASTDHRIVPIIVSQEAIGLDLAALGQRELSSDVELLGGTRIGTSWHKLSNLLVAIEQPCSGQMLASIFDESPYFPVPSIMDTALALRSGLSSREIAHSEASEHEIETVGKVFRDMSTEPELQRITMQSAFSQAFLVPERL